MKILWFTNTPCGAAEILSPGLYLGGWMTSLEKELVSTPGVELSVCFYWGTPLESFKHGQTTYYPVHRKGEGSKLGRLINRFANTNIDNKEEIALLLDVVARVKPDVIHIHGTEENFGLIQRGTTIPVAISIQGILSPYSEKYFSGIPFWTAYWHEGLRPKLLSQSVRQSHQKMKARAAREQEMLAMTRHVIGRTSWDRRVTRVLAPGSQYHVFEESLRESFYQQQWAKKQFDKPVQLVSTMTEGLYKGLETVVKTARILKKTGLAYTWTIVGQKETNSFPRIVKRWLKTDFASLDIHLVGGKNEGEVASILANADIYCHVSHIENSPNSPCEAMVMGVPVIATMAGGTDTTMNGGNLGLMIQDGDPYSLAGAILEVLGDFDAARLRGQVARAFALNRHDKHKNVATLLDIYKTMTAGSLK